MSEQDQSKFPLFYSAVEPLDKERHAALGFVSSRVNFAFAAHAPAVPLNTAEFNFALKSFPIVFTSTTEPQPIAVLGLQREQNLFAKPDGTWLQGAYLPAYIRRYPFIFASVEARNQFALCIDKAADMVSETPDLPFFENGEMTETARKGAELCQIFQQQHASTQALMTELGATGLLEKQEAKVKLADGAERVLGTYIGVEENRLAALSDEDFLKLRHNGLLPFIYMHLASLSNWIRLLDLHAVRNASGGAEAAAPKAEPSVPSGP